jgi:hypothetical protein
VGFLSREVYEALREIGVSDAQALKTAEALALPNTELVAIRTDLAHVHTQMEHLTHRLTHVLVLAYLLKKGARDPVLECGEACALLRSSNRFKAQQ